MAKSEALAETGLAEKSSHWPTMQFGWYDSVTCGRCYKIKIWQWLKAVF
jgi:hypothetical protein